MRWRLSRSIGIFNTNATNKRKTWSGFRPTAFGVCFINHQLFSIQTRQTAGVLALRRYPKKKNRWNHTEFSTRLNTVIVKETLVAKQNKMLIFLEKIITLFVNAVLKTIALSKSKKRNLTFKGINRDFSYVFLGRCRNVELKTRWI